MRYLALFIFIICSLSTVELSSLPAKIIIIRHAEKSPSTNELSLKGRERAAALVPYFLETPDLITFGTPFAIYASVPPKPDFFRRAIETVQPLADNLKITIRSTFESNDFKRMAEEIKTNPAYNGKTILICWENNFIPELTRAFGALQTPATWVESVYDRTWVITFQPSGKTKFQNIPQRLLYGDSPT